MPPASAAPLRIAATARACWHLFVVSLRRQFWTLHTLIAVLLLGLFAGLTVVESYRRLLRYGEFGWTLDGFAEVMITGVYLSFLLPILCLCFGTQALGGDWEERSLVWLLTRPLPRPLAYLMKFLATLPWTFALTIGGVFGLGVLAGPNGLLAASYVWPAVAWGAFAYVSLFVLIGAAFRRSTVIAVAYSFVLETIVGNMPGLVKRGSIGYYTRCIVYGAGIPDIAPERQSLFLPIEADQAVQMLLIISFSLMAVGMLVFSRREYRDLT